MKNNLTSSLYFLAFSILFFTSCTNWKIASADKDISNLRYANAIEKYKSVVIAKPEKADVKIKLANAYRKIGQSDKAVEMYKQIEDAGATIPLQDKLYYSQMLIESGKSQNAKKWLKEYLSEKPDDVIAKSMLGSIDVAIEMKKDSGDYEVKVIPLDNSISMFGETFYKNGLVFAAETEIQSAATTNPWTGYSFLDMFYVEKTGTGTYQAHEQLDPIFNSKYHDGPASFSKDNNFIVFTRSAYSKLNKQLKNLDNVNTFYLYQSENVNNVWSEPKELPFNNPAYSVGHPSLTADGKTLYFSSDMPGGKGGSDLYKATYDGTTWSTPENLGETINTMGNEVFPVIQNNGKLNFSSNANINMGGLDIFESTVENGLWSQPVNLNYPINTNKDDFSLIIESGDSTGYLSSNRSGIDRVYEFKKSKVVITVNGLAINKLTGLPLEGVVVTLLNMDDMSEVSTISDADGKFTFKLGPNANYKVTGSKPNFFTQSKEFKTTDNNNPDDIKLVFDMEVVNTNTTYKIENIYFDLDKWNIRTDAALELNKLVDLLTNNPKLKIQLQSHTDSRASDGYNMKLSERRAKSVVTYLISKGINKKRLGSEGFGESQLMNKCLNDIPCTEDEHQQNRRTEFKVISN
jgi:peptidoglycan-associated lipoprotein